MQTGLQLTTVTTFIHCTNSFHSLIKVEKCNDLILKLALGEKYPYWEFSGPYFSAFGLNMERHEVSQRIQFECEKIRTRKSPIMDTFHAVLVVRYVNGILSNVLIVLWKWFVEFRMMTKSFEELKLHSTWRSYFCFFFWG